MLGLGIHTTGVADPTTTGSAPAVQTFPPIDFPNPAGYRYPVELRTFTQNVKLVLIGKDVFYGYGPPDFDWPNPVLPRQPIERWTFTQSTPLNLLSQDKFYGLGGPSYDYPNPRGRRTRIENFTFINQSLALTRTIAPPLNLGGFPQRDFPNPRGYQRSIDLLTIAGSMPLLPFTVPGKVALVFSADVPATLVYGSDSPSGQGWSGQGYMAKYELDSSIQISGSFLNSLNNQYVDPQGVSLLVLDPTGLQSLYQYASSGSVITRDSAGHYHFTLTPSKSGTWTYKWQATGTFIGTSPDTTFIVNPSSLIAG